MKNLLQKSLRPLTLYASLIFALSIPAYFLLVDWIWLKELDENNELIAQRIEHQFNQQHISDKKLTESIAFWNAIQPGSAIESSSTILKNDSNYTLRKQNTFTNANDRFRVLKRNIRINNQNFIVIVETNVEETEETVFYIGMATLFIFLILVVGFWILNKKHTQTLWKPFQDTLQKLKLFQLNKQTKVVFSETDIVEFSELNTALDKLLQHNIATYKSQKEFTENASHELQTPVAIIKNKLDVLLQDHSLTEKQYNTIEEINLTLTRMARINKNLLLLARIENRQFQDIQQFNLSTVINSSLSELEDFILDKNITVSCDFVDNVKLDTSLSLTEILINNLLLNAIRYSENNTSIFISVTENELSISNPGKQPLDKAVLYDRFKKMSSGSKGSGLGLSIVKEICNNNNWTIDYDFKNQLHQFIVHF